MSRYDVVCIGLAIMDSIIRGFDPEPVSTTGFVAESGSLNAGGDAVNEAVACSKLGLRTAILCSLGRDPAGEMIAGVLEQAKVDTDMVLWSEDHQTPVTTIFVNADGNRKSITNSAHKYNFHPERYPELFSDTKAIILGSLFRAPFNDKDVIRGVLETAAAGGIMVFADTKLPNFGRLTLDDIADLLPMIDYITPNEDEARYYTGEEEPEKMAEAFLAAGARNVMIKLGIRGCYFRSRSESMYIPAFAVDVIDAFQHKYANSQLACRSV